MLEEIRIRNFAIIHEVDLDFAPGFNVITGETGAGKSIIIDAVELLLGSKTDADLIRQGAEKAIVEAVFSLDEHDRLQIAPILEREDLLDVTEPDLVTITREIRQTGRSSGRVNGITVNSDLLREIGEMLIDIHGQSAHLSLLNPKTHIDLLDRYADLMDIRSALANVVRNLQEVQREITVLSADKQALERRAELLRYEVEEITAADLDEDEEDSLKQERNRLANSEQLARLAMEAAVHLNGDEASEQVGAVDALMQTVASLSKLADIDADMNEHFELAENLSEQAQELAIVISGYGDDLEFDPDRLNEVEERIELINSLKRRFHVDTIAEVIKHGETISEELDRLEHSDDQLKELKEKAELYLHHIGELAQRISNARELAGKDLSQRVVQELQDLRMENTEFQVVIQHQEDANGCYIGDKRFAFDATGVDQLEFMMSANPGQPLRPVAKVASGGESARIMLALKRVLSQADQTPTLIFDEIDQGIGGRVGGIVGEKLWSLSKDHQVLCVTHLPQLASYADVHYQVQKHIDQNRTITEVNMLVDDSALVTEIADMLGTTGDTGRHSAFQIIEDARSRKQQLKEAL